MPAHILKRSRTGGLPATPSAESGLAGRSRGRKSGKLDGHNEFAVIFSLILAFISHPLLPSRTASVRVPARRLVPLVLLCRPQSPCLPWPRPSARVLTAFAPRTWICGAHPPCAAVASGLRDFGVSWPLLTPLPRAGRWHGVHHHTAPPKSSGMIRCSSTDPAIGRCPR